MATAVRSLLPARMPRLPSLKDLEPGRFSWQFLGVTAGLGFVGIFLPAGTALLVLVPVLIAWYWGAPMRGVYVLLGGATMVEIYELNYPDSLTDRIHLFLNLNNSSGLDGVSISPAEVLMITVAVVAISRGIVEHTIRWPGGRLMVAYCVYLAVIVGAEVHGMLGGGDFKTSLWELRPQVYGFILFFLTTSLITDRKQVAYLALIFILGVTFKSVLGNFRYFVTLGGVVGGQQEVFEHADSYFLGLLTISSLIALIWLKNRRAVLLIGLTTPLALVATLANQRRTGVYALGAALLVIMILGFRFEPALRKKIAALAMIMVVAGSIFVAVSWNKQYGIQAQLVRPIRSFFDPTTRDFLSDQYRTAETANLRLTFRSSPVIGVGFGSPYLMVYPMADISSIYPLWNVIPHNSLMWVGMRMGALGFVAFWGLIGMGIVQGCFILGKRRDPLMRAVAAFAIAAIVAEIVVGYADLQLENYRNLIFLGVVLGVLNRIPELPQPEGAKADDA
jgi:hypothetical protein